MTERIIDLAQAVHTLCTQYPELVSILKELGFSDIAKPGMLATAGRFMTIPKGAAMKKIDLDAIYTKLEEHGYKIQENEAI